MNDFKTFKKMIKNIHLEKKSNGEDEKMENEKLIFMNHLIINFIGRNTIIHRVADRLNLNPEIKIMKRKTFSSYILLGSSIMWLGKVEASASNPKTDSFFAKT